MTKEECLKALQGYKELFELHQIDYYVPEKRRKKFLNNFKCIENLIDEHFDNPPLKFEELKKGMWVWDDGEKCYFKCNPAISTDMAQCVTYNAFWYNCGEDEDEFFEEYDEFEENRFYRKEVK